MNFCIDSLLWTKHGSITSRDEGTVKTMDTGWTSSEEGEDREVGRKDDGHSFLGRNIIHIDYLPSKQTINSDYYAALLKCFNNILKKKTSPSGEEEGALPSRQCTGSHVPGTDGQIQRILRIASLSSIFARFSLLRLFPASKLEEMIRRKEIHHQRIAHRRNRGLFWSVGQIILWMFEKVEESLDQVYPSVNWKETMLRNKNESIKKNVFYYIFLKTYWLAFVHLRIYTFIINTY